MVEDALTLSHGVGTMSAEQDSQTPKGNGTSEGLSARFRRKFGRTKDTSPAPRPVSSSSQTSSVFVSAQRDPSPIGNNHAGGGKSLTIKDPSAELWMYAYQELRSREPELVANYETCIFSDLADPAASGPTIRVELLVALIKQRMLDREEKQWALRLRKRQPSTPVREQGEKIIKFVLWSKDFVSAAVSTQPYAALAWSGVSVLLEVSFIMIMIHVSRC